MASRFAMADDRVVIHLKEATTIKTGQTVAVDIG